MATRRRSFSSALLFLFIVVSIFLATSEAISTAGGGGAHQLGWMPAGSACRGKISECLAGDEFELESETSRRILATSGYISYDALKRDSVPCSRRGASYYNCRPGAQANPYTRGCSAITQCRS